MTQKKTQAVHDEQPEEAHKLELSIWPIILAVGGGVALLGVITHWSVSIVGVAIFAGAAGGWLRHQLAEYQQSVAIKQYVQAVLFQVQPKKTPDLLDDDGLLSALRTHQDQLRLRRGFLGMGVIRSPNEKGEVQVVVETRWRDPQALVAYEEDNATVQKMVESFKGTILPGTLQVFDMEVVL
jgi:heme-degrading monooxygenase HmoA